MPPESMLTPDSTTGNPPAPAPTDPPATTGGDPPAPTLDWMKGLPEDIRNEPSLQKITDIGGLAKGYISAQKMLGKDKIVIPDKHATEDDWKAVYQKLGLPENSEGYQLKYDSEKITDDEIKVVKEGLFKAGLLPHQVQPLFDWYQEHINGQLAQAEKDLEGERQQSVDALKKEWGVAFDQKLNQAQTAFSEIASDEERRYINDSGLGNDPRLVRIFSKFYDRFMKEDKVVGEGTANNGLHTPDGAREEINKILGNTEHPYYEKTHPNHKSAVEEVQRLYQQLGE